MAALSYQSAANRRATRIEQGDLDAAVRLFMDGNEDYYEEVLRNLAEAQYSLTEALAREPVARFDESYRNRHRLGSLSTLHSAVRGLLRRGVIDMIKGTYVMADPFFARFVRERSYAPAKLSRSDR